MPPKLLLVEDNEGNIKLTLRFLQDSFEVLVAKNGAEGINIAKEELPDLILMDLDLPFVSGWEATEELKNHVATAHIPIIVLTAHVLKSDEYAAYRFGCDEFLPKPIDFYQLLERIKYHLSKNL